MRNLFLPAAAAAAAVAIASSGAAFAQAQEQPSFKSGIDLVRLDVRVTDADGRPVRDLKQSEVVVEEDGAARPVVLFQHLAASDESFVQAARHTIGGEVSTNQGAPRGHLYVIVFDQNHITVGNEQKFREAAQRFLRTKVQPEDRVALYALAGPGPQLDFSANPERIAEELSKIRGLAQPSRYEGPLGTMTLDEAFQIERGNESVLSRVTQRIQAERGSDTRFESDTSANTATSRAVQEDAAHAVKAFDADTRRTLLLLTDVLREMRDIDGRKSVIFISEGFYDDNVHREIEDVAAAAAQSYSVLYTLDINRRGPDLAADVPTGGEQPAGVMNRVNSLATMAAETDGLFVSDAGQRADQALDIVSSQSQDYYIVGFLPSERSGGAPDRYRRVNVRVTRAGARASTRTGYALVDPATRLDRRRAIDRALAAPFPQQGLPIDYTTYLLRGSAQGQQRVIVSLGVDLPLASDRESRAADVVFAVRSAATRQVVASGSDVIALPDHADAGHSTGTGVYRVQFELPAGEYIMRAVVREPGGLLGSADRRFSVRSLDGPSVAAGDLLLSSTRGELPVRPTAYTGDGLSGLFEVYGRTEDQIRNARVVLGLIPAGEQSPITSGTVDLMPIQTLSSGVSREARIALPLEGVPAGAYVARATLRIGADTIADVVREIDIRAGRRPEDDPGTDAAASFDPREVVNGAVGREYAAQLRASEWSGAAAALRGLGRLGASDFVAAIGEFESAMAAEPPSKALEASTAFVMGWAYHGAGDDRQAISAWRRAAYADPSFVPAHLALADMYLQLSQPALAVQALRAGLGALPDSPELNDRLAHLERR